MLGPRKAQAPTRQQTKADLIHENNQLRAALSHTPSDRHFLILVAALAEIKATIDGHSDQPVRAIVDGCLMEIARLPKSGQPMPQTDRVPS